MSFAVPEAASTACNVCTIRHPVVLTTEAWAHIPVKIRLRVLQNARHLIAAQAEEFAQAFSSTLPRSQADSLMELNAFLDGIKFLEKNAAKILKPRKLGVSGRPVWLSGVHAEVHREPLGHVLVIGPFNYPLLLPGAQTMQALAAGNRVTWKPGTGGRLLAELVANTLRTAGLPDGLLHVTDESVEAAQFALQGKPDKVIFTGSASSGRAVMRELSESVTPAVMELSGADAMIVLPNADLKLVARAVAYGLRLNGAQVCMSPRRLFAEQKTMQELRPLLQRELEQVPAVAVNPRTASLVEDLTRDAVENGATLLGKLDAGTQKPLMLDNATPAMAVTKSDIFAPVISLIALRSMLELPEAYAACSYSLTASIFCSRKEERIARSLAKVLRAGTVLINDLIAPTADPRVPFGGRGESGYGVTRGAEGLLEMTAVKVLMVRRGGLAIHIDPVSDEDIPLFAGLVRAVHGRTLRERLAAVRSIVQAVPSKLKRMKQKSA